jgi:hypothetical protein
VKNVYAVGLQFKAAEDEGTIYSLIEITESMGIPM